MHQHGDGAPWRQPEGGLNPLKWYEEDVDRYAELGVPALEVCEAKLAEHRFAEQMARVADRGLAISAVQPLVCRFFSSQTQPQPQGVEAPTTRLQQSITRLAPFAAGVAFVVNTGAAAKGNVAEVIAVTTRRLREVADFAADHGARLTLEPLNAASMNTETAVWTVGQHPRLV